MNLARFPFPFTADRFRYGANVEPARTFRPTETGGWGDTVFEVDGHYAADTALRDEILARDPSRCTVLPHMRPAAWDALLYVLDDLAASYPEHMTLHRDGPNYRWQNRLRGFDQYFVFGDDTSLPCGPLLYAGRQVQEDLVLLDQREDELWADAGLVTFAADWSLNFDIGMSFDELHGPVPRIREEGVVRRAARFLLRLEPGAEYRRTNWSLTVDRRLDTSVESSPEWGPVRDAATADGTLPERAHLRVEVQHLVRLPASHAILFLIRTHLAPLAEVMRVPAWRERARRVLADVPADVAAYKGLPRYLEAFRS